MVLATVGTGGHFDIEANVALAVSIVFVLLRCLVRVQVTGGLRKLELDDWGIKVAVILFALTMSCARLIAAITNIDPKVNPNHMPISLRPDLANNGMTDDYRANLDPISVEYQLRVAGSKLHLTAWSLYASTLWCLKLCIAVFYTRLTDGLWCMKIRIRIAYVLIGVTYIVVMAIILGACRSFNHHWQINPNPGDQCMPATSKLMCLTVVILNVLTDLYLLHIPILMLWDAQISRARKFFLIILFSGGVFVMLADILRAYLILTGGRKGGAEAAYWGTREIVVAFAIGNLPIIYGGVRIWLRKLKASKMYARIQSMTKGWPGAGRINELFSRAGRSRHGAISGNPKLGPSCATLNVVEPSHPLLPLPRAHTRSSGRISTDVKRSNTPRVELDAEFGIQVTRGIKIDLESVISNARDPEAAKIGGKHSRADNEVQLGPFSTNSPPGKPNHGQISELPSQERQVHFPRDPRQRRSSARDGSNDVTWFADDSY